jgi:hypothetical protein
VAHLRELLAGLVVDAATDVVIRRPRRGPHHQSQ